MWQFFYDGDGSRVEQVYTVTGGSTLTTYYFAGGAYEVQDNGTTQKVIKYYAFAGMTVAMNDGSGLSYFLTDHLGSVVAVLNASGALLQQQRYYPFGDVRDLPNDGLAKISATDFGYTGQRALDAQGNSFSLGLMDYKARFYDAYITHFFQPDTIIPDPYNPQSLNRFSYVLNNPIRYSDPTGHRNCEEDGYNCSESSSGTPTPTELIPNSSNEDTPSVPINPTLGNNNSSRTSCSTDDLNCRMGPSNNRLNNEPPPPSTERLVIGTVGGGILLIAGVAILAVGVGLFAEDPPAGAFIAGAGAVLAALSVEVIYYTWRPLLPDSWPKHIFLNIP